MGQLYLGGSVCLRWRVGDLQRLKVLLYVGLSGGERWRNHLRWYYRSRVAEAVSMCLDVLSMLSDGWIKKKRKQRKINSWI